MAFAPGTQSTGEASSVTVRVPRVDVERDGPRSAALPLEERGTGGLFSTPPRRGEWWGPALLPYKWLGHPSSLLTGRLIVWVAAVHTIDRWAGVHVQLTDPAMRAPVS